MNLHYWILDGQTPVPCSPEELAEWFETADRKVALDKVAGICVSTVFLGLNRNCHPGGSPILFETMLMTEAGTDLTVGEIETRQYSTWDEAEAGHRAIVEQLKSKPPTL